MKKNMVLKDNIVAIKINRFTRVSSRGSSEQKKIFCFLYFLSLKSKDECKKNMISDFLDLNRIWQRKHFTTKTQNLNR